MKRLTMLAIASCMAVAVGACGSSGKTAQSQGTSTTTASSGSSTTSGVPAATGSPYVVGSVGSFSGELASSDGPAKGALQAWADFTNAHGGIDGHPVKLIIKDDNADPATSLSDVQQLVTQDHVMALISDESVVDAAWTSYIKSAGVPVIGYSNDDNSTNSDFYTLPYDNVTDAKANIIAGQKAGKTKFAILYCAESPVCKQGADIMAAQLAATGDPAAMNVQISATSPSFTAQCVLAKSKGANAMYVDDASSITAEVAADCAQQGYDPVEIVGEALNSFAKSAPFNNAIAVLYTFGSFEDSNAAERNYSTAMSTYAKGVPADAVLATYAWVSGQFFTQAATTGGLKPTSTPTEVAQALKNLKGVTLGGLIPPTTFTPGISPTNACVYLAQVKNGAFTLPFGSQPVCTK